VAGQYVPQDKGKPGTYIFRAMYTDKGAGKIAPVTGSKVVTLRDAKIPAVAADASAKTMKFKVDGIGEILVSTGPGGYARYDAIDLTGIKNLSVMATYMAGQTVGGQLELRTGSVTGPLLGSVEVNATKAYNFPLNVSGVHDVYLVFVNDKVKEGALYALMNLNFQN
jgi:cytochrome c